LVHIINKANILLIATSGCSRKHEKGTIPKCIISLVPSITEMHFAPGLGDCVVGITSNCNFPLQIKKQFDLTAIED
jgi:ABC-type hemin transport system substrate-binding protein